VVLPISLRIAFKPLTSNFINLVLTSPVVFSITVNELMGVSKTIAAQTGRPFEVYIFIMIAYCIILKITLPAFPSERIHESIVQIAPADTYRRRIDHALELAKSRYHTTHLLIYGDREHFANIHYFTGYDPRFEESLLILSADHEPIILLGNEGWNYAEVIPYPVKRILSQSLSLAGTFGYFLQ
jgi:hypothetical protein